MSKNLISEVTQNSESFKFFYSPEDVRSYSCQYNTKTNLFQFCTYIFEDLLPIYVMLWMHHKNFRESGRQQENTNDHDNFEFLGSGANLYEATIIEESEEA